MSQQAEARSWWADVEHLREAAERRHATPEASMQARYEYKAMGDQPALERLGPRPDRIAMWAVLLGIFCCIVALTTAHP